MSVKIRLARRGRKKRPVYDIVVANSKSPRDGRFIEKIGTYNPLALPTPIVELNDDKALEWMLNGAQPTDITRNILSHRGILLRKHLQVGVLKGAISQEVADSRFEAWKAEKDNKSVASASELSSKVAAANQAKLEAERQVNKARLDAIEQKKKQQEEALVAQVTEQVQEETSEDNTEA